MVGYYCWGDLCKGNFCLLSNARSCRGHICTICATHFHALPIFFSADILCRRERVVCGFYGPYNVLLIYEAHYGVFEHAPSLQLPLHSLHKSWQSLTSLSIFIYNMHNWTRYSISFCWLSSKTFQAAQFASFCSTRCFFFLLFILFKIYAQRLQWIY